jgi:hypothetical protein
MTANVNTATLISDVKDSLKAQLGQLIQQSAINLSLQLFLERSKTEEAIRGLPTISLTALNLFGYKIRTGTQGFEVSDRFVIHPIVCILDESYGNYARYCLIQCKYTRNYRLLECRSELFEGIAELMNLKSPAFLAYYNAQKNPLGRDFL